MSADTLEAAGYVVLFTTTPADRLSAAQCIELYRLRWQIELQFKRWKTLCSFDRMPNFREDTIESWLYAKILAAVLLEKLASLQSGVSPRSTATRATSKSPSPMARQSWKLTRLLWPLLVSALLPMRLHELLPNVRAVADTLDAFDVKQRARQVERSAPSAWGCGALRRQTANTYAVDPCPAKRGRVNGYLEKASI